MKPAAVMLGIPVIGTLGILVAATRSGLIQDFATAAGAVMNAGLYVDPVTVATLTTQLRKR